MPRRRLPKPTLRQLALRATHFGWVGLGLALTLLVDGLRGRRTPQRVGVRLRTAFEALGGTAVKLGQQLSLRADLLPPETAAELERLTDDVPPMDWATARPLIEASLGGPVGSVFSRVDPEPIGSASVACVFRAWLPSGACVAVKVQRPGVAEAFACDLTAFNLMTRAMEALTLARAGTFTALRLDLAVMFGEEMDFTLEARYQRLFRRSIKQMGMPWVRAPKVYSALCSPTVMVTEFVTGRSGSAVLADAEGDAPEGKARLAAARNDPARLGRRLLRFSMWARFDAPFFHADPHPGNWLVLPDDELVLIDFGACGMTGRDTRRNHTETIYSLVREDAGGIAEIMLADIAPIPAVDHFELRRMMEGRFHELLVAAADPESAWPERILAGLWLKLLESGREFQLRLNLDTVRSIRAFLLYDTFAFRLNPEMGLDESERYLRDRARRAFEALDPRRDRMLPDAAWALRDFGSNLDRAEALFEAVQTAFQRGAGTGESMARGAGRAARWLTGAGAALSGWSWLGSLGWVPATTVRGALTSDAAVVVAFVGVLLASRRALRVLDQVSG